MINTLEQSVKRTIDKINLAQEKHDALEWQFVVLMGMAGLFFFTAFIVSPVLFWLFTLMLIIVLVWGIRIDNLHTLLEELYQQYHVLNNALPKKEENHEESSH